MVVMSPCGLPWTSRTVPNIYSVSKPTSMLIHLLRLEEGGGFFLGSGQIINAVESNRRQCIEHLLLRRPFDFLDDALLVLGQIVVIDDVAALALDPLGERLVMREERLELLQIGKDA